MLRKICPVCEQPMRLSHYCAGCRRFVKTPCVREITYYLNESHPEKETDCDYHGVRSPKNPAAGPSLSRPAVPVMKKKSVFFILAVMVLIRLAGSAVKTVGKFSPQPEPDYGEYEDYELLSVEEVQAQGTACSGNGHYTVSGEEADSRMKEIIEAAGYEVAAREISHWNYRETGEEDPWSNYETTISYLLEKPRGGEQGTGSESVMIYYDTATDQLHGINFYVTTAKDAADMTEGVLKFLQEQGEIPGDPDYSASVKDDMLRYTDSREEDEDLGMTREIPEEGEGRTEVYFNESDGEYYVHLWKTWY